MNQRNIEDVMGLTPMQEGILFHYLVNRESDLYYEQVSLALSGTIDAAGFETAWKQVIKGNEMLRACFKWEHIKSPVQVIQREVTPDIRFYNLQNEPESFAAIKAQLLLHRWNIDEQVPFLVALCKLADDRYEMIIMHHHILFDGWSTGILLKEFFVYYNEPAAAKRLKAGKSNFKEYIRFIKAGDKETVPAFWKRYLSGMQEQYIGRRAESMVSTEDSIASTSFTTSQQVTAGIRKFTNAQQVTLAAYLYGCWAILLRHYTDCCDTLFGTTVSGRQVNVKNIEQTVGLFINTLPVRVNVDATQTIARFFKEIATDLLGRTDYELASLSQIKQSSGADTRGDLFESIVVLENYPVDLQLLGKADHLAIDGFSYRQNSNYQLTLNIHPKQEEITFTLFYKKAIYSDSLVRSMLDSLENIIHYTTAHPEALLDEIDLLSADQQKELPGAATKQEPVYAHANIFDHIADNSIRGDYGNKAALISASGTITYADLLNNATAFAQTLIKRGVRKGAVVAIYMERCPDVLVAMLGIWLAGAAYLPLDPDLPQDRIDYILQESAVDCLVVSAETAGRIKGMLEEILVTDLATDSSLIQMPLVTANDPAYVIYTSGSTGRPKGVVIGHGNISNFVSGIQAQIPFDEETRFLSLTTVSFDIFVLETILPLVAGNSIYIGNRLEQKEPRKVAHIIAGHTLTLAQFTPSQLEAFLEEPAFEKSLAQLKFLLVGGEAFPEELLKKLQACCTGHIYNMYGPTETTVWSTISELTQSKHINIGAPIRDTEILILNGAMKLVPRGVKGNLYIGGAGMAKGYLNNPALTQAKFVDHPYKPGQRLYSTGDCAIWNDDRQLVFRGRKDTQVKLRGFRIELGEIEYHLLQYAPVLLAAVVIVQPGDSYTRNLCAFYTSEAPLAEEELKKHLRKSLPEYMVPSFLVHLNEMPLTGNKKIDRNALPGKMPVATVELKPAAFTPLQDELVAIWSEILQRERIGADDNFFDIGGTSLLSIRLVSRINKQTGLDLSVVDVFEYPSLRKMSDRIAYLRQQATGAVPVLTEAITTPDETMSIKATDDDSFIAVIGMAGRFPQAPDLETFWNNLSEAIESVKTDTGNASTGQQSGFIRAKARLEDAENFDAAFFGYTPAEAAMMDPQMRVFHELAWEALEHAGYDPSTYKGAIGLYAGATPNTAFESDRIIHIDSGFAEKWNSIQYADKDFMSTRISYKLDLKGPSYTIHAACSTSLVAIDLACSELRNDKCDMALAGGISITFYDNAGYQYTEGMIFSPDGHCRAFDKDSNGTVGGNGAGIVVLKKLKQAIRDRDNILAVVRGSAINNDGNNKTGYTAPGISGQESVLKKALLNAKVEPGSVSYIETHGTGTPIGDVIEIEALKRAYSITGKNTCAIGSVKTNIGHLDVAAGVAGFIKTVLALQHQTLPASLHFNSPNPGLRLEDSSFYVNGSTSKWMQPAGLRRAGVTSLGLGGTNVHVILEEASPVTDQVAAVNPFEAIIFSASSQEALERYTSKLEKYLINNPAINISDLAYTLQAGRKHFNYRRALVATSVEEAVAAMATQRYTTELRQAAAMPVIFMFSGQGTQYVNMGYELYTQLPAFRKLITDLFAELEAYTGENFLPFIYPVINSGITSDGKLNDPYYTQPIKFIFEYALSRLLMSWGIRPVAMIGHSFGEYTAACLAGVFSFADALKLIMKRGVVMNKTAEGRMLSVGLSEDELRPLLPQDISLAAINAPELCIISGAVSNVAAFEKILIEKGIETLALRVKVGGHSALMEPVLAEFAELAAQITYHAPAIPFISGTTGKWITDQQACDPQYWADHLRKPIRFYDGLTELLKLDSGAFLQIGPGKELCLFVEKNPDRSSAHVTLNLLKRAKDVQPDLQYLSERIAALWTKGCVIDWQAYRSNEKRYRVAAPSYSFEKQLFPISLAAAPATKASAADPASWLYIPSWRTTPLQPVFNENELQTMLVFEGKDLAATSIMAQWPVSPQRLIRVTTGTAFKQVGTDAYELNAEDAEDYYRLVEELGRQGIRPNAVLHLWSADHVSFEKEYEQALYNNYFSICWLAAALEASSGEHAKIKMAVVSSCMQYVTGDMSIDPLKAPVMAAMNGVFAECSGLIGKSIDIGDTDKMNAAGKAWIITQVVNELLAADTTRFIAYRGYERLEKEYRPIAQPAEQQYQLPSKGVVLITGGLSGAGFEVAKEWSKKNSKLVLNGRSDLSEPVNNKKKERLLALQQSDAEVIYLQGDISLAADAKRIVDEAEKRFGQITGVVHAAGLPGGKLLPAIVKEHTLQVMATKVKGTLHLHTLLADHRLDFFLLFSSLNNMLPAVGQTDYSAANFFLDSFAANAKLSGQHHIIAINWDQWKQTGMAIHAERKHKELTGEDLTGGITASAATGLINRLATTGYHQVIVSSVDLLWRISELRPADLQKIDKLPALLKAAPAPDRSKLSTVYNAPAPGIETELEEIWKSVLGFEGIGTADDFFELGGDSIRATILLGKIRKKFLVKLLLKDFIQQSTIGQVASLVGKTVQDTLYAIGAAPFADHYPLSPSQQRLLFLQNFEPSMTAYNETKALRLRGAVNKEKIVATLQLIMARHESLRTTFHVTDGEMFQVVHESAAIELEELNLVEEEQATILGLIKPFNLSQEFPIRVALIQCAADDHILVIDIHHIAADGYSSSILVNDFFSLYFEETLLPLSIHPKDYAVWSNAQEGSDERKTHQQFWKQQFENGFQALELPLDLSRPEQQQYNGAAESFILTGELQERLAAVAQQYSTNEFTVLLTAYFVFLYKITGQYDIIIGTPASGRNHGGLEQCIGMFVNMLPIRQDIRSEMTFATLLAKVKSQIFLSLEHQDYQFENIVKDLGLSGDSGRMPLVDTAFIFNDATYLQLDLDGLSITPVTLVPGYSKFDLALYFNKTGNGNLEAQFHYKTSIFRQASVQDLCRYFSNILVSILQEPAHSIGKFSLLTAAGSASLIDQFNEVSYTDGCDKSIHGQFEEQAARTPGRTAIVYRSGSYTYATLNEQASRMAAYLISKGAVPRTVIAVLAERSAQLIVFKLAVLKAGCVYVPVSSKYPKSRINYILNDSRAHWILCPSSLQDSFPYLRDKMLDIEEAMTTAPLQEIIPFSINQPAYIIYTSGSTGQPKGVIVGHKQLNAMLTVKAIFDDMNEVRVMQTGAVVFDVTVFEIWLPLLNGATLYLQDEEDILDAVLLKQFIITNGISFTFFTPALFNQLLEQDSSLFNSISTLILGGDVLSPVHVKKVMDNNPALKVYNGYGPTEATVFTTMHRVAAVQGNKIPIGKGFNSRLYVVNTDGQIMPPRLPGELWIAGTQVAQGYLNNPDFTASKFIKDPFNNGMAYKTGDIVKWNTDGNVDFVGRRDTQIKIRGYRVDTNEIETRIAAMPGIKEIVVAPIKDEFSQHRLVAWFTAQEGISAEEIRAFLGEQLPAYMMPSHFSQLDYMPVTVNGKLDRASLPIPAFDNQSDFVPPATQEEIVLAGVWQMVLKIDTVGIKDNFFDLGGDSIKSIQIVSRLRAAGYRIEVRELFHYPTIAQLSRRLIPEVQDDPAGPEMIVPQQAATNEVFDPFIIPAEREKVQQVIDSVYKNEVSIDRVDFLSPIQEGILFHHLHGSSGSSYAVQAVFTIGGPLQEKIFEKSLNVLIARHEALRTRIIYKNTARPLQVSLSGLPSPLVFSDIAGLDDTARSLQIAQCSKQHLSKGFDLLQENLMRVQLFKVADKKFQVIWTFHHIVQDGWCLNILLNELFTIYQSLLSGQPHALAPARQYSAYLGWRNTIDKQVMDRFWHSYLVSLDQASVIPAQYPHHKGYRNNTRGKQLQDSVAKKLYKVGRTYGMTVNSLVQSAWSILLSRYNSASEVAFGVVISGRPGQIEGIEGMIGLFINTIPVRIKLEETDTVESLLQTVQENNLACIPYQYHSLADIQEQSPLKNNLVNHLLVFENYPSVKMEIAAGSDTFTLSDMEAHGETHYDFSLIIQPVEGEGLRFLALYNELAYHDSFIENLLEHFTAILEQMVMHPAGLVSHIDMLSAAEKKTLIGNESVPGNSLITADTVCSLLAEKAITNAQQIALEYAGGQLTYAALHQQSTALAAHLFANGTRKGSVVAIKMKRSANMVVAMYAVMKAGAAYVPLDMDFPDDRVAFILKDSNATVLLNDGEAADFEGVKTIAVDLRSLKNDNDVIFEKLTGEEVAYIMYTSGSTGKPKGVVVAHKAMMHTVKALAERYPLSRGDSYLFKTPAIFDVCIHEIFGVLPAAGRLVVAPYGQEKNPGELLDTIYHYRVTHLCLVPSLFNAMVHLLTAKLAAKLQYVRYIFVAGEAMDAGKAKELAAIAPAIRLVNAYGPTEASIYATTYDLGEKEELSSVPIGAPLKNVRVYIMTPGGKLQPVGVEGELFIAGDGVAREYLNNPALTAASFFDDPFFTGDRMYRTGDIAKWLQPGIVDFCGRVDKQIKVRGQRIEPGEIEAVLREHSSIDDVVVGLFAEDGDKYLAAWYVGKEDVSVQELKTFLQRQLPAYMVPFSFTRIEAIPLTASGKVNQAPLPHPVQSGTQKIGKRSALTTAGGQLLTIWASVLKMDAITILPEDNFFEKGGHSIKAIYLLAAINNAFTGSFKLADIYRYPVFADMLQKLEGRSGKRNGSLKIAEKKDYYPLSSAQERIFYIQSLDPGTTAYNMPYVIELNKDIQAADLQNFLGSMVGRYDTFRLAFAMHNGKPIQRLQENTAIHLEAYEIPGNDVTAVLKEFVRPFDLGQLPLLRAAIVTTGTSRKLLVDVHHIIFDGTSQNVIREEFSQMMKKELWSGKPAFSYLDYVEWQTKPAYMARIKKQELFWYTMFKDGFVPLNISTDGSRSMGSGKSAATIRFRLDEKINNDALAFCRQMDVSEFVYFFTVFNVFLSKITGQEDIIVGVPVAGRSDDGLASTIGMFVNYLPVRTTFTVDTSFQEFLYATQEQVLLCFENQDYQYDKLFDKLQIKPQKNRNPLFDVVFNYVDAEDDEDAFKIARDWGNKEVLPLSAKTDLILRVLKVKDSFLFEFEYAVPLFKEQTIQNYVTYYTALIKELLQQPEQAIAAIKMNRPGRSTTKNLLTTDLR